MTADPLGVAGDDLIDVLLEAATAMPWAEEEIDRRLVQWAADAVDAAGGVVPLVLTGAAERGVVSLLVSPTLLLQDAQGDRAAVPAPTVPLDGRPHRLELRAGPVQGSPGPLTAVGLLLRLLLVNHRFIRCACDCLLALISRHLSRSAP